MTGWHISVNGVRHAIDAPQHARRGCATPASHPTAKSRDCLMTNYRFPKRMRLLKPNDFERVFAARRSAGDGFMVLYGAPSNFTHSRLGLTVSRKVGSAVVRNRWKRALREAFRLVQHELPPLDIICIPRAGAEPDVRRLCKSFPSLSARVARQFEHQELRDTERGSTEMADRGTSQ
jgi:ribonuclease P protein component